MTAKLTPLQKTERKIARIRMQLAHAEADRAGILSATQVVCESNYSNNFNRPGVVPCGKPSEIGKLTFIRMLHYVRPYGCTGGDYWQAQENDALFVCPHCGYTNRLLYKTDILALRAYFAKTEDREMR